MLLKNKLSIIIPYCNEWPQIVFTVASIYEELHNRANFEILLIDNSIKKDSKNTTDMDYNIRTSEHFKQVESMYNESGAIKYFKYYDSQSHWQAKNFGVKESLGNILFFCDAHCIVSRNSLFNMYQYFCKHQYKINGTLHLPLTYTILERRRLIYKLAVDLNINKVHYSFTPLKWAYDENRHYNVPCMSTCGMMITKDLLYDIGLWPQGMGIYGGGENFLNFTLAVIGKKINIYPVRPLRHHADKRGYSQRYDDNAKNRIIAAYIYGGQSFAKKYTDNLNGNPEILDKLYEEAIYENIQQRKKIKELQTCDIIEWLQTWTGWW